MIRFFFLSLVFTHTLSAKAQDDSNKMIRVAAVVQHAVGETFLISGSGSKSLLKFLKPIYEGQSIEVAENSTLKLKLRNLCVLVLHGPFLVTSSVAEDRKWQGDGNALRILCPGGAQLSFDLGQRHLEVAANAELFISHDSAISVGRGVKIDSIEMEPRQIYHFSDGHWSLETPQTELLAYDFLHKFPPPRETAPWAAPKPVAQTRPPTANRIRLSAENSWGSLQAENPERDASSLSGGGGARLQLERQSGHKSWILSVAFDDIKNSSNNFNPSGPPANALTHEFQNLSIEGGVRFSHSRWWSPFVLAGIVFEDDKVNDIRNDFMYFSYTDYKRYALRAGAGIDMFYAAKSFPWLGVFASLAARWTQTVLDGGAFNQNGSSSNPQSTLPPGERDVLGWTALFQADVDLGLIIQF